MAFSKSFPKRSDKSVYPRWDDVFLSKDEELSVEKSCREENVRLMRECIKDAGQIIADSRLKDYQTDLIHVAIALFEKRASHVVFWKENKAKDKFMDSEGVGDKN
ncbi:hypothetical protein JW826_02270 [Candidatus Woesearchaeota archaeon]|nr:hypothetical protein [Candidatus Woesearchaeota archaeon]